MIFSVEQLNLVKTRKRRKRMIYGVQLMNLWIAIAELIIGS